MKRHLKLSETTAPQSSVRRKIVWLLSAFLTATAAVLVAVLVELRSDAISAGENLGNAFTQLIEEQTARTIQGVDQTLQIAEDRLSSAVASGSATEATMLPVFRELLQSRPFIKDIWVVDERGRSVYSSAEGGVGLDSSDRPYFQQHRDRPTSGLDIGAPMRGAVTGQWSIPVSRPWRGANGEVAGIIVASLDPRYFDRTWTLARSQDRGIGFYRDDGIMLMRSPFDERLMGLSIAKSAILERQRTGSRSGTIEVSKSIDGMPRLLAYRRLEAYPGFGIVVAQTMAQVLASWWRIVWIVGLSWVVAAAVLGALAVKMVREWEARRATELRYRMMFDASPLPAVVFDRETLRYLAVNEATVKKYGWSRDEMLAMTVADVRAPEDLPTLWAGLKQIEAADGESVHLRRLRRKEGAPVDTEVHSHNVEFDGRPAILSVGYDISRRSQAEQARHDLQLELAHLSRQSTLGEMAASLGDELNQPLTAISGFLNGSRRLVEQAGAEAPQLREALRHASDEALRAGKVIRRLRKFVAPGDGEFHIEDLQGLVEEAGVLALIGARERGIRVAFNFDPRPISVLADRARLQQVLVNLLRNAQDAMEHAPRRELTVTTRLMDDGKAEISVSDTGSGISPEVAHLMFQPFVTTKANGTGFGLSISRTSVEAHQGKIWFSSNAGGGTVFHFTLPVATARELAQVA